jgi:CBS domain
LDHNDVGASGAAARRGRRNPLEGERLVGLITDRDITVRSTAAGIAPDQQRVAEVMTADPRACREDDDARDVLRRMSKAQVRRMPVVDAEGCLIGIVSLGDLATEQAAGADEALRCISTPSEPDRSGTLTTARADAARNAPPGRLSEDEQRELDRRLREPDPGRPDEGRAPGSGVAETGGQGRGFALGDEDHVRAAFGLSGSPAQGGDQEMRGGYGGEGYRHYGASYSSGALGGGAGGPAYFGGQDQTIQVFVNRETDGRPPTPRSPSRRAGR